MTNSPFATGFHFCHHCDRIVTCDDRMRCPRCKRLNVVKWYPELPGYREFLEQQSLLKEPTA